MQSVHQGRYITAARHIVGWTLRELAAKAEIGEQTLAAIENGKSDPRDRTLNRIKAVLSRAGVDIMPDGVRERRDRTYIIEGANWFAEALEIAQHILTEEDNTERELLVMYARETISKPEVLETYRRIIKAGIRVRKLMCEDDTHIMGNIRHYRWVPKDKFKNDLIMIAGDHVMLAVKDSTTSGVVIHDGSLAGTLRMTFELLWEALPHLCNQPTESTADVRY